MRAQVRESIVRGLFSFKWRRTVDEGDGGVNSQLRRRLGLHGLLGTLLVPQPCGDARLAVLLHLQHVSFFLLSSLSRNRALNFAVCAGTPSEIQRGTARMVDERGRGLVREQQGSRACSGAPFYTRGVSNGRSGHGRISPENRGGFERQRRSLAGQSRRGTGARGCGEARGGHRPMAYDVRDGVAPACLRSGRAPRRQRNGGAWATMAVGTATVYGR